VDAADTPDQAAPRSLGQAFAAERERQGLARADVAQRLHMSAYQIEAIETGDYSRLPRGTFLRGFVRNYAKILGLAPEALLPLLDETGPHDSKPGIVVPTQNIRFDPIGERLSNPYVKAAVLAMVAIAVAFAAMYWWLFIKPTPPGAMARKPVPEVLPPAASRPSDGVAEKKAPVAVPMTPEPAKAELGQGSETAAEPSKAQAAKAQPAKIENIAVIGAGDGGVLKFRFKGPSWVEIRDGRGRLLLSRLNAPGSEAEVSGRPPFNVVVGNAPEVQLFYNDHEFDLEPHTKIAVARFTVE
jgi:cytoskeleton protein RodZ